MGFLKDLVGAGAGIVGTAIGGPVGGAIGSAIGGLVTGGDRGGVQATQQATQQQLEAIRQAQERIESGAETAQGFLSPFAEVGQRGIDLSTFLGDPQAQAQLAFDNPLFQLSRDALVGDINRNAAARGRLTSGDTLEQLQQAGVVAAQPFIDRQRQDILNLLNLGSTTAGQQVGVEQNTARVLADLITGGGATQAGGTIAAQNAEQSRLGNIFDVGVGLAGNQDVQNLIGGIFKTPPPTTTQPVPIIGPPE